MATPTGKERRDEHRRKDLRGGAWKEAVEELLMKEGAKRAQAYVGAQEEGSENDVVMRIPITFFVSFPRRGKTLAGDGDVDCACTIFQDEGGEVCTCLGTCPFPECCDEGPIFTEKV
jgi:hypothetical protein